MTEPMLRRSAVQDGAGNPRVAVIVSPVTRRTTRVLISAIQAAAPSEIILDVRVTRMPGDAIVLARAASVGAAAIIAVGGDGTVAEVATGIFGRDLPLGIIPAGSTNITARELGIPSHPDAAAALIFGNHRRVHMDVGVCGERLFLHMAGAGLDSRFFARTSQALKRRVGWLAYLPPAAAALRQPPARFTITTDDQVVVVESPLVLVANGASIIAPAVRLHPEIRGDDGWLDVLVFTAVGSWSIAQTLGHFLTIGLKRSPHLMRIRTRRVELVSEPPLPVELDGDVVAETPVSFTIAPGALEVIVPR